MADSAQDGGEIHLADEPAFRIGGMEFHPSTREAYVADQRIILEPRVLQVLTLLARSKGRIVSRDELIARCWAGRSVGDDAINRVVSRLRKLSDADGGRSFLIETVPRVGYGLREIEQAGDGAVPTAPIDLRRRNVMIGLGLASVVAAGGGTAAWWLKRSALRPRIAVLPFDTDVPAQRMIADGLVDELIGALMTVPELDVVARSSSFAIRGARKADAAELLGATYLIDGSLHRLGDVEGATVDLIDAAKASTIWSQHYPFSPDDLSKLQARIGRDSTAILRLSLTDPDLRRSVDPVAYRLFLQGRGLLLQDPPQPDDAVPLLKQVVARAPDFSRGWSTLSSAYVLAQGPIDEAAYTPIARVAARDAARRAIASNGSNAEAFAMLATATDRAGRWAEIERLLGKALALEPANPDALYAAGTFYADVGWNGRSIDLLQRAWGLDPLNTDAAFLLLRVLEAARRDDDVEALLSQVRGRWQNNRSLWRFATRRAIWKRHFSEAEALVARAPPGSGSDSQYFSDLIACMQDANSPRLATFLAPLTGALPVAWPIYLFTLAMIGKTAPCLELIRRIYLSPAGREQAPTWVLLQVMMRPLWGEPALRDVLRQLGLVDFWRARGGNPLPA